MARCRGGAPGRGGRCVIAQMQEFDFRAEAQHGRAGHFRRDGARPEAIEVEGGGKTKPEHGDGMPMHVEGHARLAAGDVAHKFAGKGLVPDARLVGELIPVGLQQSGGALEIRPAHQHVDILHRTLFRRRVDTLNQCDPFQEDEGDVRLVKESTEKTSTQRRRDAKAQRFQCLTTFE